MEEAQLISVSLQGTEMYLRLAGAGLKEALKFLKFLITVYPKTKRWWIETSDKALRQKLTQAEYEVVKARKNVAVGSMDFDKFIKTFGAEERVILNIPDESAQRFLELSTKNGLAYAVLPDLNFSDGMFQVMVPSHQTDIYKLIIDKMVQEELERNNVRKEALETEYEEMEKEYVECKNEAAEMEENGTRETEPELYEKMIDRMETIELTKEQIEQELEQISSNYSHVMSYDDYVKTNPLAVNHADTFEKMMDNGTVPEKTVNIDEFIRFCIDRSKNETSGRVSSVGYDKAIADVTVKTAGNKEKRMILADERNLNNYICGYSYQMEKEDGSPFLCTEYEVYRNGEKQTCDEFSHGRFTHYSDGEARNSSESGDTHWDNMKKEMHEKSGLRDNVLVFNSMETYQKYKDVAEGKEKGEEFLVNPEAVGMALRKDPIISDGIHMADRYVLIKNGEDTKIAFEISKGSTEESRNAYVRTVKREFLRDNPQMDMRSEWIIIRGRNEFEEYCKSAKKKTDTKELALEFDDALGAEADYVKSSILDEEHIKEEQKLTESGVTVLHIPKDANVYAERDLTNEHVLPEKCKIMNYIIFSNNFKYQVKVPVNMVKIDAEGNKVIILHKDEYLEASNKYTHKKELKVKDQKSLAEIIYDGEFGKNTSKEIMNDIGKEKHAAKIQK